MQDQKCHIAVVSNPMRNILIITLTRCISCSEYQKTTSEYHPSIQRPQTPIYTTLYLLPSFLLTAQHNASRQPKHKIRAGRLCIYPAPTNPKHGKKQQQAQKRDPPIQPNLKAQKSSQLLSPTAQMYIRHANSITVKYSIKTPRNALKTSTKHKGNYKQDKT